MRAKALHSLNVSSRKTPPPPLHIFGTVHTLPFYQLPPIVQKNVRSHDVLMDEVHSGKSHNLPIEEWQKRGYLRTPEEVDHFSLLENEKQAWLTHHIKIAYPNLFNDYSMAHFTPKGLRALYETSLHQQGMDAEIGGLQKSNCLRYPLDYVTEGHKYRSTNYHPSSQVSSYRDCLNPSYSFELSVFSLMIESDMAYSVNLKLNPVHQHYLGGTLGASHTDEYLLRAHIKTRNLCWFPEVLRTVALFNESKIMVSVGADHLFGFYGILCLLQRQGYEIRRLYTDGSFRTYLSTLGTKRCQKVIKNKHRATKLAKKRSSLKNRPQNIFNVRKIKAKSINLRKLKTHLN